MLLLLCHNRRSARKQREGKNEMKTEPQEQSDARAEKTMRLLALVATSGRPQIEQIDLLTRAGFQPKEIASILGTTSNTVSVAKTSLAKKAKKSPSKKSKRK